MKKWLHSSYRLEMAAVFFIWAIIVGWLLLDGQYQVFLRKGFWPLMLWSLIMLTIFSFVLIRRISLSERPVSEAYTYVRFGTLILPVIFILMAREQSLDSYAFDKRSGTTPFKAMQLAGPAPLPDDGKVTILEIMENIDHWKGRRVVTKGIIYHDEEVPDNCLVIYRFLMVCCAADAMPISLLVGTDNTEVFDQDQWVRVEGILGLKHLEGFDSPYIEADKITLIDSPGNKYLYPRFY